MLILPPTTQPPNAPTPRLHAPAPGRGRRGYLRFRQCLRWDFGFTCAFCLLHESDLTAHGAEGTGLFWIEHLVPQSAGSQGRRLRHVYPNCFYSCHYCNNGRRAAALTNSQGLRILDPTASAWSSHFQRKGRDLAALTANAEYTRDVYRINDVIRDRYRRDREEKISECLTLLREAPSRREGMVRLLRNPTLTTADVSDLTRVMALLDSAVVRARQDLARFEATPKDAATRCKCSAPRPYSMPPALASQFLTA